MGIKNNRLLKVLKHEPVDCTPVWVMRQAGRYLPEYRKVRERAGSFMNLCKQPDLACEVTLQPLKRFDLDAAIIFKDILTIPDAMGLGLHFVEGVGPQFEHPLTTEASIERLTVPEIEAELDYVSQSIKQVKQALSDKVPLIGFSGTPWTLATYMVSNATKDRSKAIKKLMYTEPQLLHRLLDLLTQSVVRYLNMQIEAGVDVLMLFDSWGGVLTQTAYEAFSLHYIVQIMKRVNRYRPKDSAYIPTILFTKGGSLWLEKIVQDTQCDALSLDWQMPLGEARRRLGQRIVLQGNLDPSVLLASPDRIVQEVEAVLSSHGPHGGHIFNLGHGITPDIPPDHLAVMVDAVHEKSARGGR